MLQLNLIQINEYRIKSKNNILASAQVTQLLYLGEHRVESTGIDCCATRIKDTKNKKRDPKLIFHSLRMEQIFMNILK